MTIEHLPHSTDAPPIITFEGPECRTVASCKRKLAAYRLTEIRLREALSRNEILLRQKDELIQNQALLSKESDHRLLNDLQVIVSLLSLQSRASANTEIASQLAAAADRIATIGRMHRRLHYCDGVQSVAFKQFLDDLCRDFSTMLSSDQRPERAIVVEGARNHASVRHRHSAWLHRQRNDHERGQVRQRPDHHHFGTESRKGLRALGLQ